MLVHKMHWDRVLHFSDFSHFIIRRHPMTGQWPGPGMEVLVLNDGIRNPKLAVLGSDDFVDLPDDWFLPCVKRGLPPEGGQYIHNYIFSEKGWDAVKEEIDNHWPHKKHSFKEYEKVVLLNLKYYRKVEARRLEKV